MAALSNVTKTLTAPFVGAFQVGGLRCKRNLDISCFTDTRNFGPFGKMPFLVQFTAVYFSAVLCSSMQCTTVQRSGMQCNVVYCSAVACSIVKWSAVYYSLVQCSAVKCSAVQCSVVQCSAVQCSAVQCSADLHLDAGGPSPDRALRQGRVTGDQASEKS